MKFITVMFLMLICSLLFAVEKIIVVTEEWPPYVYQEDNVKKGFDYEIMISVFEKMGYTVDFNLYPWKRCISMMQNKQADAILDISSNEERKKFMYFPDEKISDSSSVLFCLKGKKYTFNKLEDLKGLTIGTLLGYEYSKEINEANFFKKEEVNNLEQNFTKLEKGRIDLFISNKNVALFEAKKLGFLEKIDYLPKEISGGDNFIAFSMKPSNEKMVKIFSDTLKEFKKTKEYKEILKKYGQ